MFNSNLLKAKMMEKGVSTLDLCEYMDICETTFYRKLSRNGNFSRAEIEKIAVVLTLSIEELERIFFAKKLA